MLRTFIQWHLRLGFMRIYLYFDDPDDAGVTYARRLRRKLGGHDESSVRVLPCNGELRSSWTDLETAQRWDVQKVQHMVEVRQLLNAEHALRLAHSDGDVDWHAQICGIEASCDLSASASVAQCDPLWPDDDCAQVAPHRLRRAVHDR